MLLALTLLGCSTWIDQEPACDQDVYYWSDDVLAHLLTGDGSGEFDYDPQDTPRTLVTGEYEPSTGDFDWIEKYDPDFYLDRAEVEGFGTVYHNGNLDLLFTRTVTDMLGDVFSTDYRVQRNGCDMLVATWDTESGSVDSALVQEGSYADDSVWEWEIEYPGYSWQGGLRKNLSRTERIEADDGSYFVLTTSTPEGEADSEFAYACGDYFCRGNESRHFDGSLEQSYEAFDGDELYATIQAEYDYDGSGTSHIEYVGGDECTFEYDEDDNCTYECSDGTDGNC